MNATVTASLIAAAVFVFLGLLASRRVTSGVPGRLQLAWESVIDVVERRAGATSGLEGTAVVPLALSLFGFVAVANLLRVIPGTTAFLPNPVADLNLTAALAIVVIVMVHGASMRRRGVGGYLRRYTEPYWWMAPMNVLEELVRPFTLALRLFGTAFAGGLVIALIGELVPAAAAPVPHAVWALFDLAIGLMQAFILALLTILYYEAAVGTSAEAQPTLDDPTHPG
ncbi:MAG: F0F1 ATP synthase subunit A [Streptosporangiaceae bacterium]